MPLDLSPPRTYPYSLEKVLALQFFSDHKLTIERDDGVHRCLFFGKPNSGAYHFRLTTWPGHLCISGDIGTYVFSRTRDMFAFHASCDDWAAMPLKINPDYWAEKLVTEGGRRQVQIERIDTNEIRRQMVQSFKEISIDDFYTWGFSNGKRSSRISAFRDLREQLEYLSEDDSVEGLYNRLSDMEVSGVYTHDQKPIPLLTDSPWEYPFTRSEFDFSFLISCYAIVWGIKRYAQHKQGRTQKHHDAKVLTGTAKLSSGWGRPDR